MFSLFPELEAYPSGFYYTEDFISEAEEQLLLNVVASLELQTFVFRGYEARRRVASFGYDYHFNDRTISPGKTIPPEFDFLIQKTAAHLGLPSSMFAEVLVTDYPPGSVINWHRDAPPFDLIAGISLLSDCKFKLRPYKKELQKRNAIKTIAVKNRSLYCMRGEARDQWEHSIDKTSTTRFSITLRTLRK